jgi:hypothetical protein
MKDAWLLTYRKLLVKIVLVRVSVPNPNLFWGAALALPRRCPLFSSDARHGASKNPRETARLLLVLRSGLWDVVGSTEDVHAACLESLERVFGVLVAEAVCGLCDTCRDIELYTGAFDHGDDIVVHPSAAWCTVRRLAEDVENFILADCKIAIA